MNGMRRVLAGIGVLAAAGGLGAQDLCPGLEGNPELLTPGTATCALDATGNPTFSLNGASLIRWDRFTIPEGRTFTFDFLSTAANRTVVNFTTGAGRNAIDGSLLSNGRVVLVTPGQRLDIAGTVQADSFLASTVGADNYDELLNGQPATFGSAGGGGRLVRVEPGAFLQAVNGDLVLGGETVSISGGATLLAPAGAVRTVSAEAFALSTTGPERLTVIAAGPLSNVVSNGRVEGADVEMKAGAEISNGGLIEANGGVGRVFLRVGPGGRVINSGTGMINGLLQVTGDFDNVGDVLDPDTGDAATTVKSAVSRFPALRRPGEKAGTETVVVDTGGVAASVDNKRERRAQQSRALAGNRTALHRKSSFFGLRGGATRKTEE